MCYYPFIVNVDISNGSCNTLDDSSGRECVATKTKGTNLYVFDMIARITES